MFSSMEILRYKPFLLQFSISFRLKKKCRYFFVSIVVFVIASVF